jgi:hypothetical protein
MILSRDSLETVSILSLDSFNVIVNVIVSLSSKESTI